MVRVFSLKSTPFNMWVMWIYIVWVKPWCIRYDKIAKQNVSRVSRKNALPTKYSRKPTVNICHDSSHSNHVLSICFTSQEGYSWATLENFFDLQCVLSLRTFSHTQPLQWNPTYNTRYIRLNIITIKFSTELKPTQNSCKLQLYKNGQTQKKFDFGNLFIFLSRPRETPHLEREREPTLFSFFWGAGGVLW